VAAAGTPQDFGHVPGCYLVNFRRLYDKKRPLGDRQRIHWNIACDEKMSKDRAPSAVDKFALRTAGICLSHANSSSIFSSLEILVQPIIERGPRGHTQ
jgi:hypothetical protein